MPTSFEYIEEVMDRAVETAKANTTLSDAQKAEANKKARRLIAGFRVHDEEEEKKVLDRMIAERRSVIEKFIKDREDIRKNLASIDIKPLAICPTQAWSDICFRAGLYVFSPDRQNKVGFNAPDLIRKYGSLSDGKINALRKGDWKGFLDTAFPGRKEVRDAGYRTATLILPDPPADVARTLTTAVKLKLKVAAVADAISFIETPAEIVRLAKVDDRDLWAQARGYEDFKDWVKRDPIVFYEHGTATAIIAQFGDFPIEKEVVDGVIASNSLISDNVEVETLKQTVSAQYTAAASQQAYQMQMVAQLQWGNGTTALGYVPTTTTTSGLGSYTVGTYTVNSADWTGRNYTGRNY
jgi:hypothetical protein